MNLRPLLLCLSLHPWTSMAHRPKGTFDPTVPTRAPTWKDPHPERIRGEHFFAFHGLHLQVQEVGTHDGEHSEHEISHRFSARLRHPHMNKALWKFVEEKCTPTWSHTKPKDHHFAATVHLHERKLYCWSGYKNEDVTAWQNDFDVVTYLAHIDALGSAPRAFWYTGKFDTRHHADDVDGASSGVEGFAAGADNAGNLLPEEAEDEPPLDDLSMPSHRIGDTAGDSDEEL